jgi:hypothetical protein
MGTIKESISCVAKKVGGYENFWIILFLVLDIIMILGVFGLEFMIKVFDNMCYYNYSSDYINNCVQTGIKPLNLSLQGI